MLPKIDVPVFEMELISNGEKIKYRPFTVKEEKIFLMAYESKDMKTIVDATKQVINNCIISEIDVENLPIFDIENIFINLRSKSVGEVVNLRYRCNNKIFDNESNEDKICNQVVELDFNLNDIETVLPKKDYRKIEITENMGVMLKYPNLKLLEKYNAENDSESVIETIINCIEFIYDKENVYYAKDTPKEELVEFLDSMQSKDIQKFKDFFDSTPKLQKTLKFKCPKCKYEEDVLVEGIESFFG